MIATQIHKNLLFIKIFAYKLTKVYKFNTHTSVKMKNKFIFYHYSLIFVFILTVAIDLIVQHIRDLLNSEHCTQYELAEGLVPTHINNVNASRLH